MLSLVDKNPIMETNPQKLVNNNTHEAVELLGLSSSDSFDSPSFSHFQAPKQKRKVRFKKPFRSSSRLKSSRSSSPKPCKCTFAEGVKVFSLFALIAVMSALLWYVIALSTRLEELQARISDFEAGNRNTPEALHVIHSSLKQLDSNVSVLYYDLKKSIADIENMTGEVKLLKDTASSLKASIASAPAIQQLPKDMHSLSESVANFGSKLTALESNVKELKDQQSNIQTTAQNLSGELEAVKTSLQDLTNSSDVQARSSNSSGKDSKLQSGLQDTNKRVDYLQGQLTDTLKSFDKLNNTCNTQLHANSELSSKIDTLNDAIVLINNSTLNQDARLVALEVYLHTNLSLHLEQLEPEKADLLRKLSSANSEKYLNKTIADVVLQLINNKILRNTSQNASGNSLAALEHTHDILVLLAALLQKFEHIPDSYILNNKNATEVVENMLREAFNTIAASKETKIFVHKGKDAFPSTSTQIPESTANGHLDDFTTPVFIQTTLNTRTVENDDTQNQLIEAFG